MASRPDETSPLLMSEVLDSAPTPTVVLDRDLRLRYANQASLALLDREFMTDLIGVPITVIVPALTGTSALAVIERGVLGARSAFSWEVPGTGQWFAVTVCAAPDGVAIHGTDISARMLLESSIEQAETRLHAIINAIPDPVLAVNRSLTVTAVNSAYAAEFTRIFGVGIHVGENLRDLLAAHPAEQAETVARWERAAVGGEEFSVRRFIGGQGQEQRVYEVRYGVIRDTMGALVGAVSRMSDVTLAVRDRSALTALTERLEAVIRYSPDRVIGVDKELFVLALNEHAQADFMAQWGLSIAVGDNLRERLQTVPANQRDVAITMWERAVRGDAQSQFGIFGLTPETMRAYEISFGALRDANGDPAGAVMVATDVTDREAALSALRESETRFRALGDAAPIGIFLADSAGHCTYANPRLQQIFRLDEATLLKQGIESRVHPDDRAGARDWLGVSGGDVAFNAEVRLVMADGTERLVFAQSAAIHDENGAMVGRVGTADDVTEARRAAEARRLLEQKMLHAQKSESLEVLAGGIAHDFNNLLVGILGNASLALLDLQPGTAAFGPITDVKRAAHRASELTRQMLAYSGRGQLVVESVDISELVSEMGSLLRTVLSRNAQISFELVPTLPLIEADATQLRQVIMNLITNASDAVGETGGRIHVRTGRETLDSATVPPSYASEPLQPGEYVFVEVRDTGEGMSEETLSRIFEPFFTTKFTGRGLGLAATLGIVRGHHGGMAIRSAPGVGSTFRVLLPVHGSAGVLVPAPTEKPAEPLDVTTGTVLIIDDDETVRVVASRLLERRGHRTVIACDGREGVARFAEAGSENINLVLLDLTMPDMDGAATMAELRRLDPDVRVLLTSGHLKSDVAARFSGIEPTGFVQKPFRAEELYAAVNRALR